MKGIYDDSFYDALCTLTADTSSTTHFVLGTLMGGGLIVTGALFPNILQVFFPAKKTYYKHRDEKHTAKKIQNSLYYLKKQHYVKILKQKNGQTKIQITAKGKKHITKVLSRNISLTQPKTWDKKWRVLLFDIPIEKNAARSALRRKIKELNFFQLQKSVWVYPYPCADEILYIAHEFDVEPHIELFTAERLLHEKDVRAYFKL